MFPRRTDALTDEQSALAARYYPLALSIARRYQMARGLAAFDDEARSAAALGLLKAARAHDPTRGSFSAYARKFILGELLDSSTHPIRPTPCVQNLGPSGPMAETIEDHRDFLGEFEARDEAESLLARLRPGHVRVVRLVVMGGLSQSEAAREIGCSHTVVRKKLLIASREIEKACLGETRPRSPLDLGRIRGRGRRSLERSASTS